jgi:hypothetical protein
MDASPSLEAASLTKAAHSLMEATVLALDTKSGG